MWRGMVCCGCVASPHESRRTGARAGNARWCSPIHRPFRLVRPRLRHMHCQAGGRSSGCPAGRAHPSPTASSANQLVCRLKCRDVRTRECGIQDIHHKVIGGPLAGGNKDRGCMARLPPRAQLPWACSAHTCGSLSRMAGHLIAHQHPTHLCLPHSPSPHRCGLRRWSSSGVTTPQTAGGRRSWSTETRGRCEQWKAGACFGIGMCSLCTDATVLRCHFV